MATAEETRAQMYLDQCAARRTFIESRALALMAPTSPAAAVADAWRPTLATPADPMGLCDIIGDSAQLGQLTSGGPTRDPSSAVERLRDRVGDRDAS